MLKFYWGILAIRCVCKELRKMFSCMALRLGKKLSFAVMAEFICCKFSFIKWMRDSWFHFKRNWQQYLSYFYRLIDLRKVRSYINIGTSSRCHFHFILATYFIFHSLCPCLKFFTSWYFSKYLYRKCEKMKCNPVN